MNNGEIESDISALVYAEVEMNNVSLDEFEEYRITDSSLIEDPIPIVTISGEIISTAGNITTLSGQSKSGKSAALHPILSASISHDGNINDQFDGLEIKQNIENKAVIHIDTEQAKTKHFRTVKTILRRSNNTTCPEHFLSYNFRELEVDQCSIKLKSICDAATQQFGGIHIIVIDGIADFVLDPNDQAQSIAIIKTFEQISIKYSCPLITVIHTNPGTNKERGHLGSGLQRKSESVLEVTTNGDVSTLEPKFLRMSGKGKIPLIQFTYDSMKGYHVFCGNRSDKGKDKDIDRYKDWAKELLPPPKSLKYMDLTRSLMDISGQAVASCKKHIKNMIDLEIIIKTDELYRLNIKGSV